MSFSPLSVPEVAASAIKGDHEIALFYFSSSWCPDCKPVTTKLVKFASDYNAATGSSLPIFFVSSDYSASEMLSYASTSLGPLVTCLAYEGEDRANLKRFFGSCAGKEVAGLGMSSGDRKNGIPALVLFNLKNGTTGEDGDDQIDAMCSKGAVDVYKSWCSGN